MAEFSPQANRARRAQGAIFLFGFGGAWLSAYVIELLRKRPIPLLAIATPRLASSASLTSVKAAIARR